MDEEGLKVPERDLRNAVSFSIVKNRMLELKEELGTTQEAYENSRKAFKYFMEGAVDRDNQIRELMEQIKNEVQNPDNLGGTFYMVKASSWEKLEKIIFHEQSEIDPEEII